MKRRRGKSCGGYCRTIRGGRWNFCAVFWRLMRRTGSWSSPVSGRSRKKGAKRGVHARNDLLHFDSFPTRPTNGGRILRFFTNINPTQNRVWLTSQTFEAFGPVMVKAAGLTSSVNNPFLRSINSMARALHIRSANSSPYDDLMHRCHNAMKEDAKLSAEYAKSQWEFPPDSSWMVFTDCVSHAVLSGQYALEQTFLVPPAALVEPQRSPLAILESLTSRRLTV